jgi:hypothetical protein
MTGFVDFLMYTSDGSMECWTGEELGGVFVSKFLGGGGMEGIVTLVVNQT